MMNVLSHYFQKTTRGTRAVSLFDKLKSASNLFLGCPYVLEPLGEGRSGRYSQEPLWRTDVFDCVTYVDTVLALAHAANISTFKRNMRAIRYQQEMVDYTLRTDWFTDVDWNPRAQALGWLLDVTPDFANTEIAETIIDKPGWYRARHSDDLKLREPCTPQKIARRLVKLQAEGSAFVPVVSQLAYIPLNHCFQSREIAGCQPNVALLKQLPDAFVIEIVRPNWPIKDHFKDRPHGYGTNLNVSHLGLVFKETGTQDFTFYHAAQEKTIVALGLFEYLKSFYPHKTIKGIHIEAIGNYQ